MISHAGGVAGRLRGFAPGRLAGARSPVMYCGLMSAIPTPAAARSDNVNAGGLRSLFAFFNQHRRARAPLVLATVVATSGTTYRKRGAQMLIRNDHQWHGLLSGGCLEGDLAAHANDLFGGGRPASSTMRCPR
jgi:hypothetical protein